MTDEIGMLARSIRNLDTRIRDLANAEAHSQSWVAPTLVNSWANSGGAYAVAGYWKDPAGLVHLRGRVTGGAYPSDAFVLPVGFRPQYTQSFIAPGTTTGVVDVETDGSVRPVTGSGYVVLDGITFRAYA